MEGRRKGKKLFGMCVSWKNVLQRTTNNVVVVFFHRAIKAAVISYEETLERPLQVAAQHVTEEFFHFDA